MLGYKSRDVVQLTRDPFGVRSDRTAIIASSAARPRAADRNDTRTHTIIPLTKDLDTFSSHGWGVVLDKSADTENRDLRGDSVAEVWEMTPVTEKIIGAQFTRITKAANKRVAKATAQMILDDDP